MRAPALSLLLCCLPVAAAQAHPHVFVDTDLTLETDAAGMVTAVTIAWTYDDFFSLLIFEDMGLDPDGDGTLNGAELVRLKGFDLVEWPDWYEGDIYLTSGGAAVALDLPQATEIAVDQGRITATHRRMLTTPVPANRLILRQYDPTYYVAYSVRRVEVGPECTLTLIPAEPGEAERALAEALPNDPEARYESIQLGVYFADTFELFCGKTG